MTPLVALEYGDLCRAESVIDRAEDGVCVAPKVLVQAGVMRRLAADRIKDMTGLDPAWQCPQYPYGLEGS